MTLKNPRMVISRGEAGGLNVSGLGSAAGPPTAPPSADAPAPSDLAGTRLAIDDGLIVYARQETTGNSTAMKIAAAGEYDLTNDQLNLHMVVNHGRGEVLATVTGSAASPSVRVTPTTILRELNPATIEHGLRGLLGEIP